MEFYEASRFYIDRERKKRSSMPSRHYHNGYEIFYLVSGDICYFIGDRAYQAVSGSLFVIDMNEIHKLVNAGGASFERVTLEFKKEFLDDLFARGMPVDVMSGFSRGLPFIKLSVQERGLVERLFDHMIREFTEKPEGYESCLKTLLYQLLLLIRRKTNAASAEQPLVHSVRNKTFEIVDYINRHYQEKLTIADIAQRYGISPSYFCKTFRQSTGYTFTEYVNHVRIKEAKGLLAAGNDKVAAVAGQVGFESLTHFGRVFKEVTGMSPLKYRRQYCSIRGGLPGSTS